MNHIILQFKTVLDFFDWRAGVDIGLIALVFFFLYRTFRTSGTWKIVIGIAFAAGVFLVAYSLKLKAIMWIYSNLSNIFLIALIIIFQPELRRIFERAASLKRMKKGRGASRVAQLLVDISFDLANRSWGAILVFPGRESIAAWTSGGTRADAAVSLPILLSIFDPGSPGHDGAVVIENGRIVSFGLRLPVSASGRLSEKFGTRHHAAQGLSENTDALILAVSEERGEVSLFFEGERENITDPARLKERIEEHWKKNATFSFLNRPGERKWVTSLEFTASLAMAFLLWSSVVLSEMKIREISLTVPVQYRDLPADLIPVGDRPRTIHVTLTGTRAGLGSVDLAALKVRVSFAGARPGEMSYPLTSGSIALPPGVSLSDSDPTALRIFWRPRNEYSFTVVPRFTNNLPDGLAIASVEVNPARVAGYFDAGEEGNGAATEGQGEMEQNSLLTTPIDLKNIHEDTTVFCKIAPPSNIHPISGDWPDVEVRIRVGK